MQTELFKHVDDFISVLTTQKEISPKVQEGQMLRLFATIDKINSLPEGVTSLFGENLKEWRIPTVYEGLILPQSVKLVDDIQWPDMKQVSKFEADVKPFATPQEWMVAWSHIFNLMKKSPVWSDSSIETLRALATLGTIQDRVLINGYMSSSWDRRSIPVVLQQGYEAMYFSDNYHVSRWQTRLFDQLILATKGL